MKKILSVILLVALGVGGRVFFVNYIGIPNFEIVSSFALLSGFFLGGIFSFLAPLLIIFLSDLFIGNTAILLFTWSAFGIIGLMGMVIKKGGFKRTVLQAPIFGIIASCFFFIYTNFGWWVLSGMYPHTLSGLIACYVNALPFFKTNLLGNLILAPMVFSAFFAFFKLRIGLRKFLFGIRSAAPAAASLYPRQNFAKANQAILPADDPKKKLSHPIYKV